MAAHWREVDGFGFTVPNAQVYPWQWLWDSCFHSIIWAELGDGERAVRELQSLFAHQDDDGFVPHVIHHGDPGHHADFWGRRGTSSITQPPMYGHAIAALVRRGIDVPGELVEQARVGLEFLLRTRRRDDDSGLITVVHPWETGADNSPRWDDFCPGGFDLGRWKQAKGDLLATVERTPGGAPIGNPAFGVAPIAFNALVVWNALSLFDLRWSTTRSSSDDAVRFRPLFEPVRAVARAVTDAWDPTLLTWVDGGAASGGSGRVRTAEALLGCLATSRRDHQISAFEQIIDPDAYGGAFGVRGVHQGDPLYEPRTYWRGPTWPQLAYLLSQRTRLWGGDAADYLVSSTVAGALESGLAEYWDPEDGTGLGAIPQSWTGLALVMVTHPGIGLDEADGGLPD